jgi:hypothetical protein
MATFTDNFNRTDSSTVGNGWSELEDVSTECSIVSNRLKTTNGSDTDLVGIYRDLGTNEITKITGILQYNENTGTGRTSEMSATIKSSGSANGVGLLFEYRPNTYGGLNFAKIYLIDGATVKAQVSKDSLTTDVGSGDLAYEVIINADFSMEARVWDAAGSRPVSADVSCSSFTPSSSGDNLILGFRNTSSYGADCRWDDLEVTYTIPVSRRGGFMAFF